MPTTLFPALAKAQQAYPRPQPGTKALPLGKTSYVTQYYGHRKVTVQPEAKAVTLHVFT